MKIFIDTEFYEFRPREWRTRWVTDEADGSRGPSTGLEPLPGANAVQLISIGAVREDGAEFYAENADFDWSNVPEDHWLQENVRPHLGGQPFSEESWSHRGGRWAPPRIAGEFRKFAIGGAPATNVPISEGVVADLTYNPPEFWGYFCDYDWVVLCGLFGRMVDLPPEFPMYCLDLKQEMKRMGVKRDDLPAQTEGNHHALADARWIRDAYNFLPGDGMSESLQSV